MHRNIAASMVVLALACIAEPTAAQDARACANEVQRLSEAFSLTNANAQPSTAIAQEPSARQGASLGNEQRQQITELVQEARTAGERGDGVRCVQRLTEARALLRQAGVGSGQPGSALGGSSGATTGDTRTPGLPGEPRSTTTLPSNADTGTVGIGADGGARSLGDPAASSDTAPGARGSTDRGALGGTTGGIGGGTTGTGAGGGSRGGSGGSGGSGGGGR